MLGDKVLLFHRKSGAAEALAKVAMGLNALLEQKPQLSRRLIPGGTLHWRPISGTNVLSPHAFGIAIDLNPSSVPYWKTGNHRAEASKSIEEFPLEVLSLFEDHGFIWGGKWYHYDLMHSEYRPELFIKSILLQEDFDVASLKAYSRAFQ